MHENGSSKRLRLEEALCDYLGRVDRGEAEDQAAFLQRYPDLKDELTGYFADAGGLERMLRAIRNASDEPLP